MTALPQNGVAYVTYVNLSDALDPSTFKANPTIAAGDFQVSTDDSALANMTTLPTVSPPGSKIVKLSFSVAEMTGSKVNMEASDVAGGEWLDLFLPIDVPEGTVETLLDIEEGDVIETSSSLVINKKGTSTPVLSKDISGSLLSTGVTLATTESS